MTIYKYFIIILSFKVKSSSIPKESNMTFNQYRTVGHANSDINRCLGHIIWHHSNNSRECWGLLLLC